MVARSPTLGSLAAGLVLVAGACNTNPEPQPTASTVLEGFAPSPLPAAECFGFDDLDEGADLRTGDRVLYELQLRDGERLERFFALAEVIEPEVPLQITGLPPGVDASQVRMGFKQGSVTLTRADGREVVAVTRWARTRLLILDADGKELGTTTAELPRDMLRRGFPAACRLSLDKPPPAPPAEEDERVRVATLPMLGLMKLMDLLREDRVLSPYFWRVVRKPVSLSLVLGVRTSLNWSQTAVAATAVPADVPFRADTWVVPMRITVNDIAVLDLRLLVTDAASPLSIVGGVLGLEATHPTDPTLRLAMLVRAARRGAASNGR